MPINRLSLADNICSHKGTAKNQSIALFYMQVSFDDFPEFLDEHVLKLWKQRLKAAVDPLPDVLTDMAADYVMEPVEKILIEAISERTNMADYRGAHNTPMGPARSKGSQFSCVGRRRFPKAYVVVAQEI